MPKHLGWIGLALVAFWGCQEDKPTDDQVLVSGIPTFEAFTDSLNKANLMVAKWAIVNDSVIQSAAVTIDWSSELEVLRKTNINHLRYRDSYSITDTVVGLERWIVFSAVSSEQEVQRLEIRQQEGRIIYYSIHKVNQSLFSKSDISFEFEPTRYQLDLKQTVNWVFENEQFVVGDIYPSGELWKINLAFDNATCPLNMVMAWSDHIIFKNGAELVKFTKTTSTTDSLVYLSDFYNSCVVFKTLDNGHIIGRWINKKKDHQYSVKLTGIKNVAQRFQVSTTPLQNVSGSNSITFIDDQGHRSDAVELRLQQCQHIVSGSILTETGDYRYLEGVVRNDSLLLSTFDGTHAYYINGLIKDDQTITGHFIAGSGYKRSIEVKLNHEAELRAAETLTAHKDSIPFRFKFPNPAGQLVSLEDPQFANKPAIVSIMGTWCSNCLDEIAFLKEVNQLYSEDLSIIALDFELISDSVKAMSSINRYKKNLELNFPILLASTSATKDRASELLPALSQISSYPTMVLLDRDHNVVRIHTGFSGPATGRDTYDEFRAEYLALIDSIVAN